MFGFPIARHGSTLQGRAEQAHIRADIHQERANRDFARAEFGGMAWGPGHPHFVPGPFGPGHPHYGRPGPYIPGPGPFIPGPIVREEVVIVQPPPPVYYPTGVAPRMQTLLCCGRCLSPRAITQHRPSTLQEACLASTLQVACPVSIPQVACPVSTPSIHREGCPVSTHSTRREACQVSIPSHL